jgi:hypothetical protein
MPYALLSLSTDTIDANKSNERKTKCTNATRSNFQSFIWGIQIQMH